MATQMDVDISPKHSVLNSSFPVLLPYDEALFMPESEFQTLLKALLGHEDDFDELKEEATSDSEATSGTKLKRRASVGVDDDSRRQKSPFIQGLEEHEAHYRTEEDLAAENKGLTENDDVTNLSSKDELVDLFYELSVSSTAKDMRILLENAWNVDPLLTLKIIFNARSIHLGKSDKFATYRAFGWLAENHPLTLLSNLKWLVRPVIEKKTDPAKAESKKEDEKDEDFDMIGNEDVVPSDSLKPYDVPRGGSHGYWKDLLNIVLIAANDQLKYDGEPKPLFDQHPDNTGKGKMKREWNRAKAKELRKQKVKMQNEIVQDKLRNDSFYRALHLTVARLFAAQLKEDKALLDSGKPSDLRKLSLAAKWAPSFGEFHDKHTFILTTIAEALFPDPAAHCPDASDRELYLRHVRENYRKQYGSPLRKALGVVERDIVAKTYNKIDYARVPSLAMDRYNRLFMEKDFDHFKNYVQDVAEGKAKISGATLLPSTLIKKAREISSDFFQTDHGGANFKALKASAEAKIQSQIIDGQWKTLVQSVRDAGTLGSSIAVCDVSGSMTLTYQRDGTCPVDSAIGLSILVAEVTAPPFGGGFITFSESPTYISIGGTEDTRDIVNKVRRVEEANWNMNTNLISVFKDVILPMAVRNGLSQDDMVKQVFVFSDMQFDTAQDPTQRWTSSFERIKRIYNEHGYEVPQLVFWNLASYSKDKPVTNEDENTVLVSGYSQGMLKALLATGAFEEEVEEEEVEEEEVEEEEVEEEEVPDEEQMDPYVQVAVRKQKKKILPITVVKKAVNHRAYEMLEVVD